ncbi:MAG TPA: 30S ribosome-binding factor RbfA [Paracoccaceae bacterium]|nr:30S ribosome-binding factor RbfA [Paracoccaceae bacterium]
MPARSPEGRPPSQRQLKVGELVRRTLSDVLARGDVHDPDLTRFSITVSEVRMSPDLRQATVFALPLGGEGEAEALEALERNKGELRRAVTREVKLKFSPDLRFVPDRSFDRMDATRRLLDSAPVRRDVDDED